MDETNSPAPAPAAAEPTPALAPAPTGAEAPKAPENPAQEQTPAQPQPGNVVLVDEVLENLHKAMATAAKLADTCPQLKFQGFDEYGGPVTEVCESLEDAIQATIKQANVATWEECEKLGLCIGQYGVKWVKGWKAQPPKAPETAKQQPKPAQEAPDAYPVHFHMGGR